jgi:hypothetical protein
MKNQGGRRKNGKYSLWAHNVAIDVLLSLNLAAILKTCVFVCSTPAEWIGEVNLYRRDAANMFLFVMHQC